MRTSIPAWNGNSLSAQRAHQRHFEHSGSEVTVGVYAHLFLNCKRVEMSIEYQLIIFLLLNVRVTSTDCTSFDCNCFSKSLHVNCFTKYTDTTHCTFAQTSCKIWIKLFTVGESFKLGVISIGTGGSFGGSPCFFGGMKGCKQIVGENYQNI